MFFYVIRALLWPIFFILFPTRHKGGRVKHKGRGIVIANHQSSNDIIVLGYSVWRKIHFMAKDSLFKNRLVGWFLRKMGVFPVNRKAMGISTYKRAMEILNGGKLMAMFPEGTRNMENEGEVLAIKNGVATFAIKTKSPIIPTFIVKRPRLFRINTIVTGKPFELSEFYDKKINDAVLAEATEIIAQKFLELRDSVKKRGKEHQNNDSQA